MLDPSFRPTFRHVAGALCRRFIQVPALYERFLSRTCRLVKTFSCDVSQRSPLARCPPEARTPQNLAPRSLPDLPGAFLSHVLRAHLLVSPPHPHGSGCVTASEMHPSAHPQQSSAVMDGVAYFSGTECRTALISAAARHRACLSCVLCLAAFASLFSGTHHTRTHEKVSKSSFTCAVFVRSE